MKPENEGNQFREYPILVPHESHGDPECCGIIMPARKREYVDLQRNPGTEDIELTCNECGVIIGIVPAAQAQQILLRMAMQEGMCTEVCPQCGETNMLTGFTTVEAYTCRHCGAGQSGGAARSVNLPALSEHKTRSAR